MASPGLLAKAEIRRFALVFANRGLVLTRVDLLEDLEEVHVEGLLAGVPPLLLLVAVGGGRLDSLGGLLGGGGLGLFG